MRRWYDEEHDMKMCEPDCVDEWLFDIWTIGCDYDGCHTAKDLKELVDELVGMANKARECLWERRLFGDYGEPKPQTNADRIRAMSDEELADKFTYVAYEAHGKWYEPDGMTYHSLSDDAKKAWLDWLRRPVKDGGNE